MKHKLRVLILLNDMNIGGAQHDVLNLAEGLMQRGHVVEVVSGGGVLVEELSKHVIPHHQIPLDRANPQSFILSCYQLVHVITRRQINILNPHSLSATVLAAFASRLSALKRGHQRPTIFTTIHNVHDRRNDKRAVWVLNHLPQVVMMASEYEYHRLVTKGLNPGKAQVVYSGVATREAGYFCNRDLRRRQEGITSDTKLICTIARLSPEKGVPLFLHAARRVLDEYPNTVFWIIGDGPLRGELEELARDLGILQAVKFWGFRTDVTDLLALTDVFVLTSVRESLPRTIREAMAVGIAVVACDVGGVPEIVVDSETGLLVSPDSAGGLAERILDLITKPELSHRLGNSGRRLVEDRFNMDKWIGEVEGIFSEDLGRG
jgi:glycosyltransferase involved in cell wall biosynthesis